MNWNTLTGVNVKVLPPCVSVAVKDLMFDIVKLGGGALLHTLLQLLNMLIDMHVCMDGTKEIFLQMKFMTVHDKQRDESLRLPPIKVQQTSSLVNSRYDSISGISKDTRIYMIYSIHNQLLLYRVIDRC